MRKELSRIHNKAILTKLLIFNFKVTLLYKIPQIKYAF